VIGSCKFHYYWSLCDIKLTFRKVNLSLCLPWRHLAEWRYSIILNLGTRWECMNVCMNKEPHGTHSTWGYLQPRASFDVKWTKICIEQNDLIVLLLRDILHTSYLQVKSTGNHWEGESVVKVSYFQWTWPNGWWARNFAAPDFRPEVYPNWQE